MQKVGMVSGVDIGGIIERIFPVKKILEYIWKQILKVLGRDVYSKFKRRMRNKYISESNIEDIFGDTHEIDKIFVNVAVFKREDVEKLEREMQREKRKTLWDMEELRRWSFPRYGMFEETYATLEPVELEEIVRLAEKNGKAKGLILGSAGIGKSTLCRYVCRMWAQKKLWNEFELVVLLEARKWDKSIVSSIVNSYCNKEEIEAYIKVEEELLAELKRRKVLFIIDGLDEVDRERRMEIKEELTKADMNYLITSRPYGIEGGLVFHQRFENTGFRDEDIEKYIRRYFEEKGEVEKGERLIEFIKENSVAFAVSHIPVMLEIICHLWREDALNAPFTVTELYYRAVELIVRKNMEKRLGINRHSKDFTKKLKSFCDAYFSVAHAAFKKGEIMIPRGRVEEAISNSECSLRELLNLGLIRESSYAGEEYYYFHHLTIQEFLTAWYIAENYTKEKLVEFIREEKFNPNYRVVFLFLAGLFNEDKEKLNLLFSTLKDEPKDLAGIYILTLTLRMLGEVKELNVLETVSVEEIVEEAWKRIMNRYVIEAVKLTHPEIKERIVDFLIELIDRYKSANTSTEKVKTINFIWILGLLKIDQKRISNVLIDILKDKEEKSLFRTTSARVLGKLGMKSETIINALLDVLTDIKEDVFVREASAQALGYLGVKDDRVIDALVDVLKGSIDIYLIGASIESLKKLNCNNEKVIDTLLDIVKDKEQFWIIRSLSAMTLGALKVKDKKIVNTLLNILADPEEDVIICEKWNVTDKDLEWFFYVRSSAAIALAELDVNDNRIIDVMIKILENKYKNHFYDNLNLDEDLDMCYGFCNENLRSAVAIALGKLRGKDEKVVNSLLSVVKNRYGSSNVRIESMNAIKEFLNIDDSMISILLEIIRDANEDASIREHAIISLVDIGINDDKMAGALYNIIKNEKENMNVRIRAIWALRELHVKDKRINNTLNSLLIEDDKRIKAESALTLAKLGVIDERVIDILSQDIRFVFDIRSYNVEGHTYGSHSALSLLPSKTLLSTLHSTGSKRIYEALLAKARRENIPVFKKGNKLCTVENGRVVCEEVKWKNLF
jgi:sacsin